MTSAIDADARALRERIHTFIREQLEARLAKLKPEDSDKRAKLEEKYEPERWLADAAKRIGSLQVASHIVKPIHPLARGTSLYERSRQIPQPGLFGTSDSDRLRSPDIVGDAAALYVLKFLSIEHDGQSLLQLATEADGRLLAALSNDRATAVAWQKSFAAIYASKEPPASDALAKQVYFPVDGGDYHLLGPLFPTSLVHTAQGLMEKDRFGEEARAAREARRKGESFPHGYREYPELAIRKLGGTNAQNIGQLNIERHGKNWLLASLPPTWTERDTRPPWHVESVFPNRFARLRRVRELTDRLREFLENVDYNNVVIRRHRAALVEQICDEAHRYAARLAGLEPGWTADARCRLHRAEQLWLDPLRPREDDEEQYRGDWRAEVSHRFGNWLNACLSSKALRLGEDEQAQWKADFMRDLQLVRDEKAGSHV